MHILIAHKSDNHISREELQSEFDNTGNVCIWPAEEIMATYLLSHPEVCAGKRVIELAAGATGLAGLLVAKYTPCRSVVITDGNVTAATSLNMHISRNELLNCTGTRLVFGDLPASSALGHYDVILAADCLFFEHAHKELVLTIEHLMAPGGVALFFAPQRGGSLSRFVSLVHDAHSDLVVSVVDNYDDDLYAKHLQFMSHDGTGT
eukprot:TRINITY_DN18548_c0_g1_i1.p1 TRINITY_DN18548_c0_g1~~TRINITY_DN18548_c0_g1_i1.p1  ORF type:complete len:206 (-),score=25.63 TRINITY_DN18548_c0_g1_i1:510-1127(-)